MSAHEKETPIKLDGLVAGADLRTHQYKFVKIVAGVVQICTAARESACIGVLVNKPNTGEPCEIVSLGIVPVVAAATIAVGDFVATGASATAAINSTASSLAFVALSAGGTGELVTVLVNCTQRIAVTV